ncbi:hypothetical protein GCM10023213_48380 [Prosthecobacter algae]|uniref:Uncharacterized protein n=1 Tax=Prosthecobacter algae TaxID=1144682 RepID=A0ABP9PUF6_9BACT
MQAEGGGDGIAPAGQVVGEVGIGVFHGEVGGLQGYVCGGTASKFVFDRRTVSGRFTSTYAECQEKLGRLRFTASFS